MFFSSYSYNPWIKLTKEDDSWLIKIIAPNINKEDVIISTEGKVLTVEVPDSEVSYALKKSYEFNFEPTEKQVEATYKDGILKIRVKLPEGTVNKIPVG